MPQRHKAQIPNSLAGGRLDAVVAELFRDLTRTSAARLINEGQLLLNGQAAKPSTKVKTGDEVTLLTAIPKPRTIVVTAQAIPLSIVFEDDWLLVINKPSGLVTHPAAGSPEGTLVNAVLHHLGKLSSEETRPGIVHRLDKDTSGLIVVAKTERAKLLLSRQIEAKRARRWYLALVHGTPSWQNREVDIPIGRHPQDRKKMTWLDDVALKGRELTRRSALTLLSVVERFSYGALLEAELKTGRTHQIRVHCQYIGHPVMGDRVYGGLRSTGIAELDFLVDSLGGQALHARRLSFLHPESHEPLEFEADPPEHFLRLLAALRELS
jgi:23S rRNA pseudouridine1911/1915/1917 synthase